jgi:transposase InsO family protein
MRQECRPGPDWRERPAAGQPVVTDCEPEYQPQVAGQARQALARQLEQAEARQMGWVDLLGWHDPGELVAYGPNQMSSWDITKLLGLQKWTYYYLYVVIDIFSRYIPGWLLATRESAEVAERFLAGTIRKHNIVADQLTVHSDRGKSMASKTVALLLADLGVTRSHSRPHCSNDNPYSEAHFKTLKYRPDFPDRFGSIE